MDASLPKQTLKARPPTQARRCIAPKLPLALRLAAAKPALGTFDAQLSAARPRSSALEGPRPEADAPLPLARVTSESCSEDPVSPERSERPTSSVDTAALAALGYSASAGSSMELLAAAPSSTLAPSGFLDPRVVEQVVSFAGLGTDETGAPLLHLRCAAGAGGEVSITIRSVGERRIQISIRSAGSTPDPTELLNALRERGLELCDVELE